MPQMRNGGQGVEGFSAHRRQLLGDRDVHSGGLSLGRHRNSHQSHFMGGAMISASSLFWPMIIFFGIWALTSTGACVWYQAKRNENRVVLAELRKLNALLADLITAEQASKILARVLAGRRA